MLNRSIQSWAGLLGGLGLTVVILAGCDKKPAGGASAGGDDSKQPIKVGVYLSLTGPTATFGQTTEAGIKLAVKQKNAAGGVKGRPLELKVYDNQGKTQETGTVVTRLVTADKVVAVIGEVASTQSLAAAPICQQYGIPMISPSSTNPQVTEIGDMIFRVCIIDPEQGYAGAKFAVDHLKAKTAALLIDQKQAYSTGLGENFKESFIKMGGKIVSEQAYASGAADFSAQLTSIKGANPDVIYVPGYYTEAGSVAKQARRLGISAPLLGGDGWESSKLAEIGGAEIDGSFYTNHYDPADTSPNSRKFVADYKKEYGQPPAALTALGYDSILVLADALERAPTTSGKELAKALSQTKNVPGATGSITIDAKRNAKKPLVIIEMKKGVPTYLMSIDPPAQN